jgi:hypothetical protein
MKASGTKEKRSSSISAHEPPAAAEDADKESPLRSYLNQMGDMQRDSLTKIFESTVDASCLPSCEHGFENQMDLLMVRLEEICVFVSVIIISFLTVIVVSFPHSPLISSSIHNIALSSTTELFTIL